MLLKKECLEESNAEQSAVYANEERESSVYAYEERESSVYAYEERESSVYANEERESSVYANEERESSVYANEERESSGDSDSDTGQKSAKLTEAKLWMKERVSRERERQEKLIAENEALRSKLEEAQKSPPQTEAKEETGVKSESDEVEYWGDEESPDQACYDSIEKWKEDIDRWAMGEKVVKPKKVLKQETGNPEAQAPQARPEDKGDETPQFDEPRNPKSVLQSQMENIKEALDDAPDGFSETLTEDFFEMLNAGKIELSQAMIDYLEATDDCCKVAEEFIKTPRKSRRMFKLSESQRSKELEKTIDNFGKSAEVKTNKTSEEAVVPNIMPLGGSNSHKKPNLEGWVGFEKVMDSVEGDRQGLY